MKHKLSKILGVGLTLALLTSLLLTATPVSALSVPTVTVDDPTISEVTDYSIVFDLGVGFEDESTITFAATTATTVTVTAGWAGATFDYATGTVTGITPIGTDTLTLGAGGTETFVTTASTSGGDVVLTLTAGSVTIALTSGTATISEADLGGDIIIEFDEDTDIEGTLTVTVAATSGIGTDPLVPAVATSAKDGQELTIVVPFAIGVGAMVEVVVSGVVNPDDPGDYTLDVSTSNEDAKTATYEIKVPDIAGLPGVVKMYNASGILMDQKTEPDAIFTLLANAGVDYTIEVGPGTYVITKTIKIKHEGLTLKSSAGAASTIIDASGSTDELANLSISIEADDVTFEGFTVADSPDDGIWIKQTVSGLTIQNNLFTGAGAAAIVFQGKYDDTIVSEATISHNVIEDCGAGIVLLAGAKDNTISNNTITGSTKTIEGGIVLNGVMVDGNIISGNTITGSEGSGILFVAGGSYEDNLIEGNTISGNALAGIEVAAITVTDLVITGNDITDNEDVGILIEDWGDTNTIKFNTITGNDADNDGYGIETAIADDVDVDATLNWWGTAVADDVAAMVNDAGATAVTAYEPFLADAAEAVFSAYDVAVGADSLDAEEEVGVKVSVNVDTTVIAVAKYIDNPEEAIDDFIAFYDVYADGAFINSTTDKATIKFYAGDANTDVYLWAAGTQNWEEVDADFSAYGGYVYVTVDPAMLTGTPFALVAGTAAELDTPELFSPEIGDNTVRLRPVFAWEAVPDAEGYYFQLADNAEFVVPLVKMEGDMGRLSGTTYAYVGEELPYSTPYHWRVKAVSGTEAAGDLAESGWAEGVFITMDEPVEPTPPVVIEPTPPAPAPIIEPIVEVITPAATPITPGWIYAIIAVGGVLVIALLVLIVRTRRVA